MKKFSLYLSAVLFSTIACSWAYSMHTSSTDFPKALLVNKRPVHPECVLYTQFGDSSRFEPKSIHDGPMADCDFITYKRSDLWTNTDNRLLSKRALLGKTGCFCDFFLIGFESVYAYIVEKFNEKDVKKNHFDNRMAFRKKSNHAVTWSYDYVYDCKDDGSPEYTGVVIYKAWEINDDSCLVLVDHYSTDGTGRFTNLGVVKREGDFLINCGEIAAGDRAHGTVSVDFFDHNILQFRTLATPSTIMSTLQDQLFVKVSFNTALRDAPVDTAGQLIWQNTFENGLPTESHLVGIRLFSEEPYTPASDTQPASVPPADNLITAKGFPYEGVYIDSYKDGLLQFRTETTARFTFEAIGEALGVSPSFDCNDEELLSVYSGQLIWQNKFQNGLPEESHLVGFNFGAQ